MMKSFQIALLIALLLPAFGDAEAQSRPSKSSSFKSGFSTGKSSSASSYRRPPSNSRSSGSFGSFGGNKADGAAPRRSVFGSFGGSRDGAAPAPQRSDSALSQQMGKSRSEENALRTLDERRAAEQARNLPPSQPVPSGPLPSDQRSANRGGWEPDYRQPQGPGPVIIQNRNDNGLVNMITGFLLAKASSPSRAQVGPYPGTAARAPAAPAGPSVMLSIMRTFVWLAILAALGWALYFGWKFLRRGSAPSRANYAFERN